MFEVTERCRTAYPGAAAGVLVMRNVLNPAHHPALEERKSALERELRARFRDRAMLAALPTSEAYDAYLKRFKKTYHVQLQLESVALKGKPIPSVAALVEAMFMAELKNQMLTAGHDLDAIRGTVKLGVATGDERYVMLNGQEQQTKMGDMMMSDGQGVISSIVYGPDRRTRIQPTTRQALFTVYAVPGNEEDAVYRHLEDIRANILLFAPEAETQLLRVYSASGGLPD